uniref:Putative secreted peptide n=1 Tax=Anopheles braziliensis TaxID=58242 RepID=A0A2M3ZQ10_9DIPT
MVAIRLVVVVPVACKSHATDHRLAQARSTNSTVPVDRSVDRHCPVVHHRVVDAPVVAVDDRYTVQHRPRPQPPYRLPLIIFSIILTKRLTINTTNTNTTTISIISSSILITSKEDSNSIRCSSIIRSTMATRSTSISIRWRIWSVRPSVPPVVSA